MQDVEIEKAERLPTTQPSRWRLLWIWMVVGAQSFGGGSATLYLIRRVAVDRHGWLTDHEFTRFWAICQIVPGINILALVILIGWRVSGLPGALTALSGLLLPSGAITIALTAAYATVRQTPIVRAAIAGVVPATVGLGLLLAYTIARPQLDAARREGRATVILTGALLAASAVVAALASLPAAAILWGAGTLSAFAEWQRVARKGRSR